MNAEKRKRKNKELIDQLKQENQRYKKMRDELQTNKQVQG